MKINFEEVINRKYSGALKWDKSDKDIIPLWVADMDFKAAPAITDAILRRAEHGIYGYTLIDDKYYEAIINWFSKRHGWKIDKNLISCSVGVIPSLTAILKEFSKPGDGVIIQPPVYNCFFNSINKAECKLIENKLIKNIIDKNIFTFEIDFDDLEEKAAASDTKFMILCNPHNPCGRNWSREELEKIKDITSRYGVRVICDEIHNEITRPGSNYIPYATIDKEAIILCSPTKSFNIAGLHVSNIISPNKDTKNKVEEAIFNNEIGNMNPFGVEALKGAYSEGGAEWIEQVNIYIYDNYEFMKEYLINQLPEIKISKLEATYLPMIDFSDFIEFSDNTLLLEEKLKEDAGVWMNASEMYGEHGYLRVNIATPRVILKEGLDRFVKFYHDNLNKR